MKCNIYLDTKYSLLCICLLSAFSLAKKSKYKTKYLNFGDIIQIKKKKILLILFKENINTQ